MAGRFAKPLEMNLLIKWKPPNWAWTFLLRLEKGQPHTQFLRLSIDSNYNHDLYKQITLRCDGLHVRYGASARDLRSSPLFLLLLLCMFSFHLTYLFASLNYTLFLNNCFSSRFWAHTLLCYRCVMKERSLSVCQICLVSLSDRYFSL